MFCSGIQFIIVKQVNSLLWYTKQLVLDGRQELVEVGIIDMRMKELNEKKWRHCREVGLKLVDKDKDSKRELSAEEIVERWELLRDCWLQLAAGL